MPICFIDRISSKGLRPLLVSWSGPDPFFSIKIYFTWLATGNLLTSSVPVLSTRGQICPGATPALSDVSKETTLSRHHGSMCGQSWHRQSFARWATHEGANFKSIYLGLAEKHLLGQKVIERSSNHPSERFLNHEPS